MENTRSYDGSPTQYCKIISGDGPFEIVRIESDGTETTIPSDELHEKAREIYRESSDVEVEPESIDEVVN